MAFCRFTGVSVSQSPERRYVSINDAAEYVDAHHQTIRRWIAEGRITGYRLGPRMIRVDLDELDAMMRPLAAVKRGA